MERVPTDAALVPAEDAHLQQLEPAADVRRSAPTDWAGSECPVDLSDEDNSRRDGDSEEGSSCEDEAPSPAPRLSRKGAADRPFRKHSPAKPVRRRKDAEQAALLARVSTPGQQARAQLLDWEDNSGGWGALDIGPGFGAESGRRETWSPVERWRSGNHSGALMAMQPGLLGPAGLEAAALAKAAAKKTPKKASKPKKTPADRDPGGGGTTAEYAQYGTRAAGPTVAEMDAANATGSTPAAARGALPQPPLAPPSGTFRHFQRGKSFVVAEAANTLVVGGDAALERNPHTGADKKRRKLATYDEALRKFDYGHVLHSTLFKLLLFGERKPHPRALLFVLEVG